MYRLGNIRTFETANFKVVVDAEEEFDLDLSFDDTGEVAEKLDSGEYLAFCAHAYVVGPDGEILADDYLGDCIYESLEAFMDHKECGVQNRKWERQGNPSRCGSYFKNMVSNVIEEARKAIIAKRDAYNDRTGAAHR